jgi:hypothetical protein
VQPIDRFGSKINGGVEPETVCRAHDVVIDGLGNANDWDAQSAEPMCDGERAIAADDHQGAKTHLVEHFDDTVGIVSIAVRCRDRIREGVAAVGGAEDRATQPQDARHIARRQNTRAVWLDQTVETVFETDALHAAVRARLHDGTNHGIETRCVATASQYPESLERSHGCRL